MLFRFYLAMMLGHFRRHRLEALLCLAGVVIAVAMVVAIESAVSACVQSFSGAVDSLAQKSTHSIFATAGAISDQQYLDLLQLKLPEPLAPVIDRGIVIDDGSADGLFVRLVGVDVFSERKLRSITQLQSALDDRAFDAFITRPGSVVMVQSLAQRLHVRVGQSLNIAAGQQRTAITVVGIVDPGAAAASLGDLVIADLATAQELTGTIGTLDRIDTHIDNDQQLADLAKKLPPGLTVKSTQEQGASLEQLIQSYRMNLNALSLMAGFVAVFIVYNSMLISVQQRQKTLGVLRCLGASRPQLAGLYGFEALLFSLAGAGIGVPVGWWLARFFVRLVGQTINDLYAAVRPLPVTLTAGFWLLGLGVAVISCGAGVLLPLWLASRTPPITAFSRAADQRHSARRSAVAAAVGLGFLLLACFVWFIPGPIVGFVMALLVSLGFALLCPVITRLICATVDTAARRWQALPIQLAGAGIARSLGIAGVAIAATMLAMAMNIGIRTMVSSFRTSLDSWMSRRFAADIYIGPELLLNHKVDAVLDPRILQWLSQQPEVAHVGIYRGTEIPLDGKAAMLSAVDTAEVLKTLPMKSTADASARFDPGSDVLISEPLAGRLHWSAGQQITLSTPAGARQFHIFGIFYDFGTERGQLMLDRSTYVRDWQDNAFSSLQIRLKHGMDRTAVARRWLRILRPDYPVKVDSFDGIHTQAMTVFDRTFRVTVVLTWLSGGIAFCGLVGSLLALSLARRRDYSVLGALGMTGRQITLWVMGQAAIIALVSALVAPVAGTVLADVLAYVIQYRSFGWSIPTHPQPWFWLENFALAMGAALAACIYPAAMLRRETPAAHLRTE